MMMGRVAGRAFLALGGRVAGLGRFSSGGGNGVSVVGTPRDCENLGSPSASRRALRRGRGATEDNDTSARLCMTYIQSGRSRSRADSLRGGQSVDACWDTLILCPSVFFVNSTSVESLFLVTLLRGASGLQPRVRSGIPRAPRRRPRAGRRRRRGWANCGEGAERPHPKRGRGSEHSLAG